MGARNRVEIRLSCRPASYTAWRNWFHGIDSWAPLKFKNSGFVSTTSFPVSEQVFLLRNKITSLPPPDATRSISTPLLKEILAYRRSGRVWRGGMRQKQANSKKILIATFINYVSSCQTHKSRTWEWGAAIGFPGIQILMLGTVWRGCSKWDTSGCILIEQYKCRLGTPLEMCTINIKGHGNEADFPRFLHKSVRNWSLTLHFEPFRFWLRIRGDIHNRKTTPRLSSSIYRTLNSWTSPLKDQFGKKKPGMLCTITIDLFKSLSGKKGNSRKSCRLPDSASQGVFFRLRISPRIRSQNRNGSKGSVRNSWGTNFCKNPRKSASLPCPFKGESVWPPLKWMS